MSEWIDGFSTFGPFLVQQLACAVWPPADALLVCVGPSVLPVQGLGEILAVAVLISDVDCVGGTAANVGYTVVKDADTNAPMCAQAIKCVCV